MKEIEICVPDNIDYDKVWKNAEIYFPNSKTVKAKQKYKDAIRLFLHYLYPFPQKLDRLIKEGGSLFLRIKSRDFDNITRKMKSGVVKTLMHPDYCVIEEDKSYQPNKKSKGYKLTQNIFMECKPQYHKIGGTIAENYLKLIGERTKITCDENPNIRSLNKETITLSQEAITYIEKLQEKINQIISKKRKTPRLELINHSIEKKMMLIYKKISQILNGEFYPKTSVSNNRITSTITSLTKEIRHFIRINNNKVVEIDISNSHLYMLAVALNKNFYCDDNKLSISKIFPELCDQIKEIQIRNESFRKKFSPLMLKKIQINKELALASKPSLPVVPPSGDIPIMCGVFLHEPDVKEYLKLPFADDLYSHLAQKLNFEDEGEARLLIKSKVMNFLNMKTHRDSCKIISALRKEYPNVDGFITMINGLSSTKGYIALLLQRIEAYLLLEVGIEAVMAKLPSLNFASVHDSLIVEENFAVRVKDLLANSIEAETGMPILFKIKESPNPFDSIDAKAAEIYNDSKKSVEKVLRRRKRLSDMHMTGQIETLHEAAI